MAKKTAEEKNAPINPAESNAPVDMTRNEDDPLFRYFRAGKEDFEDENTFQVKMSSEYPGEQRATKEHERLGIAKTGEKFIEILSHEEGDVDLSRFIGENRAPLLDEHKDNRHLGYIKTAALSKDKVTRGVPVFDNVTKLSKTRCEQVRAGSRPNFSIGYTHTQYLGKRTLEDGRIGHRFAWMALELSNVAVPMDPTAQTGRSKNQDYHCIRCGDIYGRKQLNDDFMCPECVEAEEPAETEARTQNPADRMFRAKAKDGDIRISHSELRQKVSRALDNDKRFKSKRDNGDSVSDFYHHDNHQVSADGTNFQAIVSSPAWRDDSKMYAVDFSYDGKDVTLGEATHVEPKTTLEAVERGVPFDAKQFRAVDSEKLLREAEASQNNLSKKVMPKNVAELTAENPEAVASIRSEHERTVRAAVKVEVESEQKSRNAKLEARNKEIRARADEFVKLHGPNFFGKPGEVTTVGERIRSFEQEAYNASADQSDSEVRMEFTRKADEVIRGSRPAKNPVDAADLDQTIASRCSLGRILREGMKAAEQNKRSSCFTLTDGAEAEADKEIRHRAKDFPGGAANLAEGIQLPWTMPSGVRGNTSVKRLQRDALAGDFASAGALIAPDYQFPMIELLRNFPALSRAGMTILSGLMGSPIVLPRQESATTAQSLAEGGALVQYDQVLGQIRLAAHRVGSSQKYSRLALLQATPDFEAMVMADHMAVIALKIDALGLNGQGAGDEPLGVLNQLINSVAFAGSAANAYKNAVAMETAIRKANVPDEISYITTSASRGMLKSVARLLIGATTVAAEPVWSDSDQVNGRPAWDSQQVPGDVMLAGAFKHLVMAQWGGLAVVLDTISQANQDKYWLNINTYIDFALRHNQAFCRTPDSLAALS